MKRKDPLDLRKRGWVKEELRNLLSETWTFLPRDTVGKGLESVVYWLS